MVANTMPTVAAMSTLAMTSSGPAYSTALAESVSSSGRTYAR
ncbi:Uncharacterised protein [Mycobacteroides abscessus subsp. abscessus]|nr:Uncharacterised protein [Mycobacteroides abscessus subsp. abscessus]SKV10034.1 Uncharacterised protein [Mycobacteroides abscessus subsp. abscessus]